MERVEFHLEVSRLRLSCLLNPESLEVRRVAGLRPRSSMGGLVSGHRLRDDPLLQTGGGKTEMDLDLLFDVELVEGNRHVDDVRMLTGPLWELAENHTSQDPYGDVPLVRFIWGKAWNVLGVITAVAERFERFTSTGIPRRSWLRIRHRRVDEPQKETKSIFKPEEQQKLIESLRNIRSDNESLQSFSGAEPDENSEKYIEKKDRLDQICHRYYGDSTLWPVLAAFNNIIDPLVVSLERPLKLPSLALLMRFLTWDTK